MNIIELSVILPALIAGILVLATHVPLGIEVLKRGIVFIDLAIAQVAGLGALTATLFFDEHNIYYFWVVQGCSLCASIIGAALLTWTEKRFQDIQEALIGCLFVLSASLALLLLGQNPHGGEHMKDLLAGQILFVSYGQLIAAACVYLVVLAVWFGARLKVKGFVFYLVFAVTVTTSVQLVGVYLVFASLILPALASRDATLDKRLPIAYATGAIGFAGGIVASTFYDLATGPSIVCCMFLAAFMILFLRRKSLMLKQ